MPRAQLAKLALKAPLALRAKMAQLVKRVSKGQLVLRAKLDKGVLMELRVEMEKLEQLVPKGNKAEKVQRVL